MVRKVHCLPTNHENSGVKSLNSTTVQRFVHVSIQLQEHASPILMYRPKLFFVVLHKNHSGEWRSRVRACVFLAHDTPPRVQHFH